MSRPAKIAVVLFNLGGPDGQEAVEPFLYRLFSDPAIISLPQPLRWMAAKLISSRRAPVAQEIYAKMGGKSPILEQTQAQARALETALNQAGDAAWKMFTCMRYWHPFSRDVVKEVEVYQPDWVVLLPLYPQFSTTTTASSFADWQRAMAKAELLLPVLRLCCYYDQPDFVAAHVAMVRPAYDQAAAHGRPRILFSAHGLPEKVIHKGDPYQWQVEQSVAAIVAALGIAELDYAVCYQSRVGPLAWIGPSTEELLRQAGEDHVPVVVVPVAFVSEHSETLVELDMEYRHLAEEAGVKAYFRVPALGTHPRFIEALASLCRSTIEDGKVLLNPMIDDVSSWRGKRVCPAEFGQCGCGAR